MRILQSWGIDEFFDGRAVEPESISFRRWQDGTQIAFTRLQPDFRQKYQAPYYVIHRAHFHDALHKLAISVGATLHTNAKVAEYREAAGEVLMTDGRVFSGNLIVAADGEEICADAKRS